MHGRHCEVVLSHFVRQPVDLLLRVAEDDRLWMEFKIVSLKKCELIKPLIECDSWKYLYDLCDGESVVEVAERIELPLFLLHCHEELFDALYKLSLRICKSKD